jgi:hypothetical protein
MDDNIPTENSELEYSFLANIIFFRKMGFGIYATRNITVKNLK